MTVPRPQLLNVPQRLDFNHEYTVDVVIPPGLDTSASSVQGLSILSTINYFHLVALIDLGYSSHAFHSSNRLVFMTAQLGPKLGNTQKMVIKAPPNNRVYPPGPGANRIYHLKNCGSLTKMKLIQPIYI